MQQNEEIVHLKKKLQEAKRNEELLEKNIKSLRDQIANTEPKNTQKPT
jgi:predicted  nucleic acid-binding Zn-ribbon protein